MCAWVGLPDNTAPAAAEPRPRPCSCPLLGRRGAADVPTPGGAFPPLSPRLGYARRCFFSLRFIFYGPVNQLVGVLLPDSVSGSVLRTGRDQSQISNGCRERKSPRRYPGHCADPPRRPGAAAACGSGLGGYPLSHRCCCWCRRPEPRLTCGLRKSHTSLAARRGNNARATLSLVPRL